VYEAKKRCQVGSAPIFTAAVQRKKKSISHGLGVKRLAKRGSCMLSLKFSRGERRQATDMQLIMCNLVGVTITATKVKKEKFCEHGRKSWLLGHVRAENTQERRSYPLGLIKLTGCAFLL